ncbi:MAG: ABC transporter permease [Blastocatellia bacterium]|nr:ABC transporter permease [Blastocatellia bacterium]
MRSNLAYALRGLRRKPVFAAIVTLTLALGIGANSAIFSFVDALLLTPLPYRDSERLVRIQSRRGEETGMLSLLEVMDLKAQAALFEGIASFRNTQYNITGDGPPEALKAAVVNWNLFELLGVRPILGATWLESHERATVFAIVLSHDVWQRRFGGDPNIVGQKIMLDAAPYEVLGVMPPGFHFPLDADLYRRVPPGDFNSRGARESGVIARLKPGVSLGQAQAELDALASRWEQAYPDTNNKLRLTATAFREYHLGKAGAYLWLLAAAVGVVLLIACVNVAGLMLTRAVGREKELAIRAALGADRGQLIAQMLTESLLLTLLGGAAGLGLAVASVRLLSVLLRLELPAWMRIGIDARVLAFTFVVALVAGVLTGLLPALQASRPNLNHALKEGGKGSTGAGSLRARRLLVMAQIALALVLLVGAGLLVRSFARLQRVELGFDPQQMLTLKIDPPWSRYKYVHQTAPFYRRVVEEIERIPGVASVAFNDSLPLAGQDVRAGANKLTFEIEGQPRDEQERNSYVNAQIVNHGYFEAMRIPLRAGRFFTARDQQDSPRAAVISEQFAARYWPDQNPMGRRIRLGKRPQNYRPGDAPPEEPWFEIAGVVGNVRQRSVTSEPGLDVYLCDQQEFSPESYLAIRATVAPLTLTEAVKQAVWRVDPEQSVFDIRTMDDRVLATIWQQRLTGVVFTLFAGVALTLAAVGIYGVISFSTEQRLREMGIRMALGAQPREVLGLVLREGLALSLAGAAAGLLTALLLARAVSHLFYGVSAHDPLTFAGVTAALILIALLACWFPARRAMRVDPMTALRQD